MKIERQVPFVEQESLRIAQVVAAYTWANLVYEKKEEAPTPSRGVTPLPVPMTIRIKADDHPSPDNYPEHGDDYRNATAYFHFGGGMAVIVSLVSYTSGYGEHWNVKKVEARFYRNPTGCETETDKKTKKIWEGGKELGLISNYWGQNPNVQRKHEEA